MRTIGIIQARLSSARLPAKVLAPIAGQPLLGLLANRVRNAKRVDEWWLATSEATDDDVTAAWGAALGLQVYRGSLDDVLSRYIAIAELRKPDVLLRLTADDPFTDHVIVDLLVEQLLAAPVGVALTSDNMSSRHFPLGYCPQAARCDAVLTLPNVIPAELPYHRGHVMTWFYTQPGACLAVRPPTDWQPRPAWRWTIDMDADLAMAQRAFATLADPTCASYMEMVRILDAHPEITGSNLHVRQKALEEG